MAGKDFTKGTKKFLNKDTTELGLISWRVDRSYDKEGYCKWLSGGLTIADCSRTVRLDFDVSIGVPKNAYDSLHNRLKKIDTMIDELHEMRIALIEAAELE